MDTDSSVRPRDIAWGWSETTNLYQFLRAMRCLKKPKEAHRPLLLRRCTPRAPYLPPFDAPLRRHLRLTSSFSCKRALSSISLRYLKELFFLVNYFSLAPGKPRSVGHHHRRPKVGILPCIQVHRSWEMRRPLSLPPAVYTRYIAIVRAFSAHDGESSVRYFLFL